MQQMPNSVNEYLDTFIENTPDDMLQNIYVSFVGKPIRDGSNIVFDDNTEIKIGDFTNNLSSIKGNEKITISNTMLKEMGISNFEMLEEQILLIK